ncbi:hypothetical protein ABZ357_31985 [Streptomyces sp. NPDC005917]|uniref:hypothetical protein n=1 Tax=unclassified Streptomyces TaxID=2593676 RepID=UPI0033CA2704
MFGNEYGIGQQCSGNREVGVDTVGQVRRRSVDFEVSSKWFPMVLELSREADGEIRTGVGDGYFSAGQEKLGGDPMVRREPARDVDLGKPFQTSSGDLKKIGGEEAQWNPEHTGPGK